MDRPFQKINFERAGEIYCVRLVNAQLDEEGLEELGGEIGRLIDEQGCRQLVMALGPEDPIFLYSVFLARLVNWQKRLAGAGGALALAGLSDNTREIFEVAGLTKYFHFYPDVTSAAAALKK